MTLRFFLFLISALPLSAFGQQYSGCNSLQRKAIQSAHQNVQQRVAELNQIDGLRQYSFEEVEQKYLIPEARIPSPRFKNHQATYKAWHLGVSQVFKKVQAKIRSSYRYDCMSARSSRCSESDGVYAYVLFLFGKPHNRIHLCPLYFKQRIRNQETTLLHELTHLAANTDHFMGSIFSDQGMRTSVTDAYLYGKIMHQDLEKFVKMNSWGVMWSRNK